MKRIIFPAMFGSLVALFIAGRAISQPAVNDTGDSDDKIEILTRGPLHEAFAQPVGVAPVPGELVPKEPPPPVPEEPPEQKPDVDNVQWIPGYWSWDGDRKEYLWVSGVYRVPPQGRTYVPGYWSNTPDGWRWIPGFWSNANQQEIPYTPEPPAPLDNGPAMPAPDENSMYIPGVWMYRTDRFVWRPGYWAAFQPGRVWISPYYVWTPNGYLFIDGYSDYPFDARGIAFAPVCFNQPLWRDANWRFRPSFALTFGAFVDSAFVGRNGFYFGNYYDQRYARNGIRPWYDGRGRYDSMFAYHGWQNHRGNGNWVAATQQTYANRSAGRAATPPLTFAGQRSQKGGQQVIAPVSEFTSKQINLVKATPTQIETQRTRAAETRQIAEQRTKLDAPAAKANASPRWTGEARSLSLPTRGESKNGPQVVTFPDSGKANGLGSKQGPKKDQAPAPRIVTPEAKQGPSSPTPRIVNPEAKQATPKTPRIVTPEAKPAIPTPTPRIATPELPKGPRIVTPEVKPTTPRIVTPEAKPAIPTPTPRIATPETPKGPRIVTPEMKPATPRIVTPEARPVSPAPRVNTPAPKVVSPPAPAPRVNPAPQPKPAPRATSSPPPQVRPASPPPARASTPPPAPPRVSAPAPRSNPAPVKSSPPPRPAGTKKK